MSGIPHNPIQFLRRLWNNQLQEAGNRVQLEDENGNAYNNANPLPIGGGGGGALMVDIDQVTPGANHVEVINTPTVAIDQVTAGANHVEVQTSVPEGALTDAAVTDPAAVAGGSVIALLKALLQGSWPRRDAGVLHRSGITANDKLIDFVAASVTVANVAGVQGHLVFNTTYNLTANPGTRWGCCQISAAMDAILVTNDAASTHVVDMTIAQGVGQGATVAEFYDIFCSVDAAPKWVCRITEAQRLAGGFECLAYGVVSVNAAVPAGHFYVGCVGTGAQTSAAIFAQNNAYTPNNVTISKISCIGRSIAHVKVKLVLSDLRSAPSLSIVPFFGNLNSAGDYHQGQAQTVNLLQAVGQSLEQAFDINVYGEAEFAVLIGTIAGQGAAVSIWVELN